MIKERFVPYELAKLLKEKGFDVPCNFCTSLNDEDKNLAFCSNPRNFNAHGRYINRPTYQMVIDWLESKDIIISIIASSCQIDLLYEYEIIKLDKERFGYISQKCEDNFSTRWDALEDAIKWCLNNI